MANYLASKKLFNEGKFDEFIASLDKGREHLVKETKKYFKNNQKGVENQPLPYNIGVSAESDISHLVKSTLGYGCKIYNFDVFKKHVKC